MQTIKPAQNKGDYMLYRVEVSVLATETWQVEADNETQARTLYDSGELTETGNDQVQGILEVSEIKEKIWGAL